MGNVWDAMKKHRSEPTPDPTPEPTPEPTPDRPDAAPPATEPAAPRKRRGAAPVAAPTALNGYAPVLIAHYDRGSRITEEYRSLRTNLLARYGDERFCVVVTSAEANEGKTVTCINLAMVLAERQERQTLVVDCDLRKGRLARLLNAKKEPGMADLLRGTARLSEVVQPTAYPNLFVIPCGAAEYDDVGKILGRPELAEIVGELRRLYDYVLIDTPPVNVVSDAGIVGGTVGEAILAVRMNRTRHESVHKAIGLLHAANVKPVGLVLTHQKYYIPGYLYRYS